MPRSPRRSRRRRPRRQRRRRRRHRHASDCPNRHRGTRPRQSPASLRGSDLGAAASPHVNRLGNPPGFPAARRQPPVAGPAARRHFAAVPTAAPRWLTVADPAVRRHLAAARIVAHRWLTVADPAARKHLAAVLTAALLLALGAGRFPPDGLKAAPNAETWSGRRNHRYWRHCCA